MPLTSCAHGKKMSEENIVTVETPPIETVVENVSPPKEDLDKLVQSRVSEALKDIKSKLDNAYSARDTALKQVAEFERKEKDAELSRLKEEGKHQEAYELQLAQERAKIDALEKRNIELTRDIDVKNVLSAFTFKSESAAEMAYKTIVSELVRNENGVWVHRDGTSIADFAKKFSEVNNFLFEQKVSTGPGVTATKPAASSTQIKSIYALSQEEVLKLASEGKLPKR